MMTLDELEQELIKKGYTNLRIESVRSKLILADKNGRTYTYDAEHCDPDLVV